MWLRALVISSIAFLLAACGGGNGNGNFGTFSGSTSVLHTPEYAVKGKTNYDQAWINKTTEALVDSGQPRPVARPVSMDAPPPKAAVAATTAEPTEAKQVAKRKKWFGF